MRRWTSAPRCVAPTSSSSVASAQWKRWRPPMAACRAVAGGAGSLLGPGEGGGEGRTAMSEGFTQFPRVLPFTTSASTATAPAGACISSAPASPWASSCWRSSAPSHAGCWPRWFLAMPSPGGPFLLREEPPGDVQASVLSVRRRLGHVPGHAARQDPVPSPPAAPATRVSRVIPGRSASRRHDQREAGPVVPLQRLPQVPEREPRTPAGG